MNLKVKQEKIISVCVTGAVFALAAFLCRPVFYLNDDVTMRSILSGIYTGVPDGHVVYMKYPLTGMLSLLYRLTDKLPWLELFFAGCLIWAVAEMVSVGKGKEKEMFWELLPGILFVLPFFFYMHYTIIAAVLAGTAAFLLCAGQKVKPAVFWLVAWMIRSQVAYLVLPFLGVALLWRMTEVKKIDLKSEAAFLLKTGGIALAGLLLCVGVNSLAYANSDWKEYLAYNDARTELFDYTNFHSTDYYSENYEMYGMTEREFQVLDTYNTMLDASINKEKLQDISERIHRWMVQEREEAAWIRECVKQYYYQFRYPDSFYVILWIGMFGILMFLLVLARNWRGIFLMVCLGAGRSMIWIYLIYQGRFPERIIVSLYVIELLLLAGMLKTLNGDRRYVVLKAVFVLGAACLLTEQTKAEIPKLRAQAGVQAEWDVLKEYCRDNVENLYLLDVFSAVEYGGFQYETDCGNLMLAGGWMSASPLAGQRFADRGAIDGGQALCDDPQTIFLADKTVDVTWLEKYLTERFGACMLQPGEEIVCSEDKVFVEYQVVK